MHLMHTQYNIIWFIISIYGYSEGVPARGRYDQKEYEKAEDNATKAYKMDRTNSLSLIVLGDLAYKNEFYKNALNYYTKAKTPAEIQLAKTYQKMNRTEKAFEIYSQILKNNPDKYDLCHRRQ